MRCQLLIGSAILALPLVVLVQPAQSLPQDSGGTAAMSRQITDVSARARGASTGHARTATRSGTTTRSATRSSTASLNKNVNINKNVNRNVNRNVNVNNRNVVRVGNWTRPSRYWWGPGGAIAAGAAIGVVTAATAAAWAGPPPGPDMCWYYTDQSQRQGFWDVCQ